MSSFTAVFMRNPIRVGVVGVDYGSRVHIPSLLSEDNYEVVSLCSRNLSKVKATAAKFGISKISTNYQDFLEDPSIDMVVLATPAHLHYPMAKNALLAQKHVLCEKPFTVNLNNAKELRDLAQISGVTAMLGHEFRYSSGRAYTKELIATGYLGNLRVARGWLQSGSRIGRNRTKYNPESDDTNLGGGLLWSQGSHYIDCLMHWFGEISSVSGHVATHIPERIDQEGNTVPIDADDAFEVTLFFRSGGIAHLSMSYVSKFGQGGGFELYGDKGTIFTCQDSNTPNPPSHGSLLAGKITDDALKNIIIPEEFNPIKDERDMRIPPTRMLLRDFLQGIENGYSPSPNFNDGYKLQIVLHSILESSERKQAVIIGD